MKTVLILFCIMLALACTGCGGGGGSAANPPPPGGDDPPPPQTQSITVTMDGHDYRVVSSSTSPYRIEYANGTSVVALRLFVRFVYDETTGDVGILRVDEGHQGENTASNILYLFPAVDSPGVQPIDTASQAFPTLDITQRGDPSTGMYWVGTYSCQPLFSEAIGRRVDFTCSFSLPSGPITNN